MLSGMQESYKKGESGPGRTPIGVQREQISLGLVARRTVHRLCGAEAEGGRHLGIAHDWRQKAVPAVAERVSEAASPDLAR